MFQTVASSFSAYQNEQSLSSESMLAHHFASLKLCWLESRELFRPMRSAHEAGGHEGGGGEAGGDGSEGGGSGAQSVTCPDASHLPLPSESG